MMVLQDGLTALHKACLIQSGLLIELLIRYGADTTLQDKDGRTPIDCCGENEEMKNYIAALLNCS